ncbi:MAG: hypothetical protein AABW46_02525 [Nanoarchaeota archaeon]
MGHWAKSLFGQESFESTGIVIAGTNPQEFEKSILSLFDKVISSKDSVYHGHLVEKAGKQYPIVFNVYGAPAMLDVLTEMYDGGCRNVLFIGYAYGGFKQNLEVGSVVVPSRSFHFDGSYPQGKAVTPDKKLTSAVKKLFTQEGVDFHIGPNISVLAVTYQLPHANTRYRNIKPVTVEMELASCLSRSREIGVRATGILIISDNRSSSIGDEVKRELRHQAKTKILTSLIENIELFNFPAPKLKKEFNIDEYLASIIEDPEDVTNVYKKA